MFHFAGTLGSHEASSSHVVLQKVTHQLEHKTKVKYNPFAKLTISDKRQQAKEEQKVRACTVCTGVSVYSTYVCTAVHHVLLSNLLTFSSIISTFYMCVNYTCYALFSPNVTILHCRT